MFNSLQRIFPKLPDSGNIKCWGKFAKTKLLWNELINNMNNENFNFDWTQHNQNYEDNKDNNQHHSPQSRGYHNHIPPKTPLHTHREEQNTTNNLTQHIKENNMYTVTPLRKQLNYDDSNQLTMNQAKQILNIDNNATRKEIRLKYKLLARKYHPDKWVQKCEFTKSQGAEYFKGISNAYAKALQWCPR